jgi:hypothetical protein
MVWHLSLQGQLLHVPKAFLQQVQGESTSKQQGYTFSSALLASSSCTIPLLAQADISKACSLGLLMGISKITRRKPESKAAQSNAQHMAQASCHSTTF